VKLLLISLDLTRPLRETETEVFLPTSSSLLAMASRSSPLGFLMNGFSWLLAFAVSGGLMVDYVALSCPIINSRR